MDEDKKPQEQREPVVYASPIKRLWAWVGVVYVLLLLGLNTYNLTTGRMITGVPQLLIAPALVGLGGSVILRFRAGKGRGGLAVCVVLSGACFLLALWNLILGVPMLLGQL